ncbi:uncharacterized protein LOC129779163 [Toxorhynchites rutilus septentrionalis]|uniref:uncharacterized protein LOC129779163 n=1 Tax=Toxorhynchites rutilus septentrionalis TaxID=329112 RepID=UPI0024787831|nr:uncharacterized protein LOC129779163 [Toxorhynchites rutilus septentrionalis]
MKRIVNYGLDLNRIRYVLLMKRWIHGDSGGPLQIKLMHNARVTPFVVAVTSFGLVCGLSSPGVYTRVAPYHDWIVETMQNNGAMAPNDVYNATFCALRFVYLRNFENSIKAPLSLTPNYVSFNSEDRYMFLQNNLHIVQLEWNGETNDCYGVIIDEDTVLTLAQCVTHNRYLAHVHPKYEQESGYNNIAILRLQHFVDVNNIDPACLSQDEIPSREVRAHGSGRRDINKLVKHDDNLMDPSISFLTPRVHFQNASSCIIPKRYQPLLRNGGNDFAMVAMGKISYIPRAEILRSRNWCSSS